MKKKTILTSIFVLYTMLLLLGPGVSIPAEAQSAILNNSVSTTLTDGYPSFSKIAMKAEKNYPFNVHIKGDQPGVFTYVDFENTTDRDYSTINEKGYPTSLGTLEKWSNNPVDNPWDVEWLHISNDDLENGESATYNITLSSYPLGTLSPGNTIEFDTLVSSDYRELELIVDTLGLYVLYYDSETTLTSLHLISPNGTEIEIIKSNLPSVSDDGIPIRRFLTFMVDTIGSYRMFFKTNTRYVSFELKEISLTSEIEIGERIIYKDEDYKDIDPKTLQGSTSYFPIQYYSFPVSAGDYLRINFAKVWGSPIIRLISPTPTGYDFSTLDTTGQDNFQRFSYSGIAYIAVLHNMYFNWQWPYAVTKEPLYYKFGVYDEGIPTYPYELGTSKVFDVDPIVQNAIIEFNVTEPTSIHLNYSIYQGGAGVYSPGSDFFLVRNDTGFNLIKSIDSGIINDRYYDLVPGTYQIFIHSTSALQTDVIEFQSKILTRDVVHHKSYTKLDNELMKSDTTLMESSYFYGTDTYSTLYPSTIPFSYDNSIGFGYNLSIYPEENPQIFERKMPTSEIQVWLWNGTEYINQTYNPNALDLFVNGSATGHYAYFGAVRQFDKIQFNLHNFSSSLNYTWQYLDDDFAYDWEDLEILTDGTNATGSTLSQSGLISFKFPSNELNYVHDPDWGGNMPDVNKSMYWFRLKCSVNNPTSIPAILGYSATPPVQMYQYTRLTVKMRSEINLVSHFDDLTYYEKENEDDTLTITSFSDLGSYSYDYDGLFGTGDAIMSFWPYEVYEHDFYLDTQVKINNNINFRIATFDDVGRYIYLNYPSIGSNPTNLTALNFTTYNTYGYSGSFNESNYDGVILSVEGELYDWYQFICQSDNTNNQVDVELFFDNVWLNNNGPVKANTYSLLNGNSNDSTELGIGPSEFKLKFVAQADNSSELVTYRLNIASYRVQLLTPNLTLIPSHFETGVPSWVLPASIGGGVTIIAIITGVIIYKKKHPV
ncbi:MAG: hypothetical protein ACTSWX_08855 [Promethearchaeota archaeon]